MSEYKKFFQFALRQFRTVLRSGICGAGIPVCTVPDYALSFGASGCMADSTFGTNAGMDCFGLRKKVD